MTGSPKPPPRPPHLLLVDLAGGQGDERHLTQAGLGALIELSRSHLNQVIHRHRPVPPDLRREDTKQ